MNLQEFDMEAERLDYRWINDEISTAEYNRLLRELERSWAEEDDD